MSETWVVKEDGSSELVQFEKIMQRVRTQACDLDKVDVVRIAKRVVQGVTNGVTTYELDVLASDTAASLCSVHPQYSRLAARIAVSRLHKRTDDTMRAVDHVLGAAERRFVAAHWDALHAALVWERDFRFDYFGFKTLERSYLVRGGPHGNVVERPQIMYMRVALGIHCEGALHDVLETYDALSRHLYTHATPTMFHAGTAHPHLASCFLLPVADDSIEGIFETNKRCALISKSGGGIGLSVSNVRAAGSRIHSTGGRSAGLLPMLRCFDATARYVDQGGGKRNGAFAVYLEPWHADVRTFLQLKKNHGAETERARDLFYALWIPDLFMRRVEANAPWSLLCPSVCPDLVDLHGAAFDEAYEAYERAGAVVHTLPAQDLWFAVLDAQIETGTPYMLYKDACNAKSNQRHLGTIRSSNLCAEIVQYSDRDEVAVCNLASVSLPAFVDDASFDHLALAATVRMMTRNLNRVIDRNAYACEEARRSNLRHRPLGMGVQGLADVFATLGYPFDSPEARALNREIFETIYFAALEASCAAAAADGAYASYAGSPVSQGLLQMDMWQGGTGGVLSGRWDWQALRASVRTHGVRNSLLVAPMPTASTAQILGNNECFEPFTSNIYVRNVMAGEFAVVNKHLVAALEQRGLWSEAVRQSIVAANGSVQGIPDVPVDVKALFRTAWEMSMRSLIDMSADRAPFVDQTQSLNLFSAAPTHKSLSAMHFYGWRRGLKTGMYYLRTRAGGSAVKVTVPVEVETACASCSS
jgi:ribonucleoside-diphosphate reductase alpha subunit